MDAIETQVQRTSPILRVTTDISELKTREAKDDLRASETSRSGNSGEPNLRHASNLLQKKKQLRPLFGSPNPYRSSSFYAASAYSIHPNSKSNVSAFTQRIMSAKLLRVKQLQNELKETQIQLHETRNENRLLKSLQKRQDNALKKYEGDNAQLPQLIKSHNEEIRVISTQYKQLKASYRELEQRLRQRDLELLNLKEQNRHLVKLSRDKHLGVREKLTKQVEDLTDIVKEQNERIQAKDKYINNSAPNRFFKPSGNVLQVLSAANARFRNLPKTSSSTTALDKKVSGEAENHAIKYDHSGQDTDITSEVSSENRTMKLPKKSDDSNNLNFRKKLSIRKGRSKSSRSNLPVKVEQKNEDGTETKNYSFSFPSIDNSIESASKYNTSESDTVTRMSSIKSQRRISVDSAHTIISDNNFDNSDNDIDNYVCKSLCDDKKENIQHNSGSTCQLFDDDNEPLQSISDALAEAKAKDKLQRQKSIKDELKELKEQMSKNNHRYLLESSDSCERLFDENTVKAVKDELKEFERRLYNTEINSFTSSMSKSFENEINKVVQKVSSGLDFLNHKSNSDDNDDDESEIRNKFGLKDISMSWNKMRDEIQREREKVDDLTDSYFSKLSIKDSDKNVEEDNIEIEEDVDDNGNCNQDESYIEQDVKLNEDEKFKLLKALNEIDREKLGRKGSFYSSDSEPKERRNSLNLNFNGIENRRIQSSYNNFEFPMLKNLSKIDNEFTQDFDHSSMTNKSDLIDGLFSNVNSYKNAQETTNDPGNA
ncbi:uncharacterized protein LOC142331522 isoform X2 [Lycorma delicatula]|uniref:uncharacterized protein LOC142331522 isoform X2 n=1 Tax=Lycorma delicatula TaxID=130591 RepID=UPI003F51A454